MAILSSLLLFAASAPRQATPVDVPFRIGEDAIIVDATVNSRPVSLMFDTGFGGTVVLDNTIDVGRPTGRMTLRDFVGQMEVPTVKLRSLALGGKKISIEGLSDIVSTPPGGYSFAYNTHVDGIMGFDVIKSNITEINFEKKKFVFHPKSVDISKRVPDNKRTFLAKLLPIGGNSLEMAVETPSGKKMTLALDTGNAFYATTHKDVLERVGLWDSSKSPKFMSAAGVASGTVDSWTFKMPAVKIFGVPVAESVWDIIDLPSSSAEGDGTVGFGFLKNFNMIIDYDRRRVWLENFTGKVSNEVEGDLGIYAGFDPKRKKTIVSRVSPETPAAAAGIKEGDELLSVDGQELIDVGFRRVRKLLRGQPGTKVKLAVARDGALKRYELERKPLYNE